MSNSVQPHGWQPTRLCRPWDSPGKNTGVSCHFLLQCMKVKSESEFAQSCPTLRNPMYCSPPGSSIHGIFQARVLEWVALPSLRRCLGLSNCYRLARKNYRPGKEQEKSKLLIVVREKSHTRQFSGLLHGRSGSPFYRHHFSNSFS